MAVFRRVRWFFNPISSELTPMAKANNSVTYNIGILYSVSTSFEILRCSPSNR